MAKQLNVKLNFEADTSRAKQQIQDLQNSLNNVINAPTNKLGAGISTNIQAAIKDIANLQYELNKATNADTGKIDFTKLNHSITKSGKSLQQYGQQLMSLGPMGQQAFGQLAQAIANSEIPVFRVSNKLKELGTTLANTARWQLSSSIMHGFIGAVQSAFGYAQDLNESLNNIRIVTGQNVDQMAKFAQEANKAAKALSTTTTEYTNASLIYYQQGLSDKEVKERTDVTIKMANVARESAETVSDQMTAVWNNFYDGSKSLEYYADVMTALGAATASSTAEISEGLNKFAAVAETVGLSYEYATAALATVTATTRQSADVVGTAFKTLFARIQDLELGNTLDDGTTLGSYSQALEKVGINIIDTSGNLKQMDVILEEMAARWETLGKAEQTALAQNVAGVRQYTQLIALMENWDFMKENISTASNATGTLQAQADIYAESWEAAQDRVRAATEKIYSSLIDEDFFIDLTNGFEDILSILGKFIDSIGGIKGVLSTVGVLLTSIFSDKIAQGITNMSLAMQSMTPGGRAKIADQRTATVEGLKADFARQQLNAGSEAGKVERDNVSNTLDISNLMVQNEQKMSELEKDQNRRLTERLQLLQQEHLERAKSLDQLKQELEYTQKRLEVKARAKGQSESYVKFEGASTAINTITKQTMDLDLDSKDLDVSSKVNDIKSELVPTLAKYKGLDIDLNLLDDVQEVKDLSAALDLILEKLYNAKDEAEGILTDNGFTTKELDHIPKTLENIDVQQRRVDASGQEVKNTFETLSKEIPKAKGAQKDWSTALVAGAQAAMSAAMMINSLRGAINTLKNPDISGWEKLTSVLMSLGMIIPGLVNIWKTLKSVISQETIAKIANTAATWGQVLAENQLNKTKNKGKASIKHSIKETWQDFRNKSNKSWNAAAYNGSNRFEQVRQIKNSKDGSVTNVVKDKTTGKFMTENAAKKIAGTDATKALGKVAGGAALIAAGVVLASVAIKAGIAAWQKYDKAAEQATTQAKSAAENYNKLVEDYNTFTSNISSYEEAQKGLVGLTKGTLEYQEALIKANEAAGELLDQYENLEYTVDENGVIQIDEKSLEKAQAEKLDQRQTAFIAKQRADIYAQQKQAKADQINLTRDKINSRSGFWTSMGNLVAATFAGASSGALIGAGIGTIAGTVIPGAGNAAGAGLGASIGAIAGGVSGLTTGLAMFESSSQKEQEAMDKLAEAYTDNSAAFEDDKLFEKLLQDLEITDPVLIKSLIENRDAVKNLSKEVNQNNKQIAALNKQIVSDALRDNKEIMNSIYADEIIASTAKFAQGIIKQGEQALIDEGWGTKGINKADTEKDTDAQRVFKEWAISQGLDPDSLKLTGVTGTDKNRKFVYNDAAGKEQVVELAKMITDVATYNADKELQETAESQYEIAKKLEKSDKSIAEDAMKLLAGIANGKLDLSEIDYDAANLDYTTFLSQLTNDDLKAFGVTRENATTLLNDLQKQFNEKLPEWIHGISAEDRELWFRMGLDKETTEEQFRIALENLQSILNKEKLEATITFKDELTSALESGDFEKAKELYINKLLNEGKTGEEANKAWVEFLEKSQAERTDEINNKTNADVEKIYSETDLNALKEKADNAQGDFDKADREFRRAENSLILAKQNQSKLRKFFTNKFVNEYDINSDLLQTLIQAYENQGFDAAKALADNALEVGWITQEQYNELFPKEAINLDFFSRYNNIHSSTVAQAENNYSNATTARKNAYTNLNGSETDDSPSAQAAYEAALIANEKVLQYWRDEAKNVGLDEAVVDAQRELLHNNTAIFEGLEKDSQSYNIALEKLTTATLKAKRGLDTLYSSLPEWKKKIGEGQTEEVIPEIKDTLKDLYGLTDAQLEIFTPEFLTTTTLDGLTKVWQGEEGALSNLGRNLGLTIAKGTKAEQSILEDSTIYKFGDSVSEVILKDLTAALRFGQLTEDQIKAILSSLGFTTHIQDGQILTEYSIDTISSGANGADTYKDFKPVEIEAEHDEYHQLKEEIEAIQRAYTNAGREKDKVFGKSKLKYIEKEIDLLDQELKKTNALTAEMSQDLFSDSGKQTDLFNKYGFEFDENGTISNYNDIMNKQEAELKRAEYEYNEAMKAGSGETASVIQAWEDAQEKYETFVSDTSEYENLLDEYNSLIDKEAEIRDNIISAKLEKITTEIEFEVEISERDLNKLDYIVEKLSRNLNSMIEQIDQLGLKVGNYENQSAWYRQGIADIRNQAASENRELTDAEQRKIWEYEDALLGINNSLTAVMETVENSLLEEFNRLSSEIDENINRFETYNSILDHYKNIIKLSGRQTKDSLLMMELSAQQTAIAMDQLNASRDKYLTQEEALVNAGEKLKTVQASGNQTEIDYWQKQYDEIAKAVENTHNEMLSSWSNVLQAASDEFDLAIELTITKLKDSLSEYGLDGLSDRYEKASEETERYLSQLDKEYELNKLIRQIENTQDETDNIKAKSNLNKILSSINEKMKDGVNLSKYELEYLQSQYDVELARQTLEDARNAKSTVRLTRDNEGNFGYVYTADQDAIDEATQKYEDAIYNQRKLNEEYINNLAGQIIQNEKDLAEALANIDKTKFDTREAYEAEINRITQYYLDRDLYLRQQYDIAVQNSGLIYEDTILGQLENASSWEEAHNNLVNSTNEATDTMIDKWDSWKTTTTEAMTEVGINADNFSTDIQNDMSDIATATDNLAKNIDTATQNMSTYIGNLMDKVEDWRLDYIVAINDIIKKNEELNGISGGTNPLPLPETKPENGTNEENINSSEYSSTPKAGKLYTVKDNDTLGELYSIAYGKNYWGNGDFTEEFKRWYAKLGIVNPNLIYTGQTIQFNTGGYTGSWGPSAKLAWLDEKELVLNANDTENILRTVSFVRELANIIESQASMSNISGFFTSPIIGNSNGTLEQKVDIHAEFPNATDRYEIEEAFTSLVNRASQYANRKW